MLLKANYQEYVKNILSKLNDVNWLLNDIWFSLPANDFHALKDILTEAQIQAWSTYFLQNSNLKEIEISESNVTRINTILPSDDKLQSIFTNLHQIKKDEIIVFIDKVKNFGINISEPEFHQKTTQKKSKTTKKFKNISNNIKIKENNTVAVPDDTKYKPKPTVVKISTNFESAVDTTQKIHNTSKQPSLSPTTTEKSTSKTLTGENTNIYGLKNALKMMFFDDQTTSDDDQCIATVENVLSHLGL